MYLYGALEHQDVRQWNQSKKFMRYSDDLYKLITSLTKSEKRYFKLFASMQGNGKKYLLLFDAVDKQEEYNEPKLKEEFKGEKFIRQFAVAKSYLYNLILKSLRLYHSGTSVSMQLRELLTNVELLNDKGLVDQATKMLEKALGIATRHERFTYLIEASGWQIVFRPELHSSMSEIEKFVEYQQRVCERLENIVTYSGLLRKVAAPVSQDYIRSSDDLKEVELLMDHPLLNSPEHALSFKGRLHYHWIYSTYHYAHNQFQVAAEHAEKMAEMFEEDHERLQEEFSLYLLVLGNCLTLYRRCWDEERSQATVEKIQKVTKELIGTHQLRSPRVAASLFQASYLFLLALYIGRAEFDRCLELIPAIEKGLDQHGTYLKDHIRYKFYSNLIAVYFAMEDYDAALEYNNLILSEKEPNIGRQTYYAARLRNLILHYELGNLTHLEHVVPSTYRYLLSRNNSLSLEQSILAFFRKLPRIETRERLTEAFRELRDALYAVADDPLEQNGLRYFAYLEWLESKIQKRPFVQIAKEYAQAAEMVQGRGDSCSVMPDSS